MSLDPADPGPAAGFGPLLKGWRAERRLSQLADAPALR
jgi:hypothetical protein